MTEQAPFEHEPAQMPAAASAMTPMMGQFFEIKALNPGYLLFYRMGDFYEMFFEDAEIASQALGIVLTKRGKHQGADIPMCGVPIHAAQDYLKKLIALGHRVALCEQLGSAGVSVLSTYAFTEAKMAWTECRVGHDKSPTGFHLYPDLGIIEIVDPKTGKRVPDGMPGEIVFTPLDSRGTVVLRYRTGDVTDGGIVHERCPACGRTCPRITGNVSRLTDRHELNIDKLNANLQKLTARWTAMVGGH